MMSSERIWRDLLASEARIQRSVAEGMRREGLSDDLAGARELLAERLELMAATEPHVEFHDLLVDLAAQAFARAPSGNSSAFERLARERMAQAAQIYAIDVALGGSSLDARPSDVSPKGDCLRGAL